MAALVTTLAIAGNSTPVTLLAASNQIVVSGAMGKTDVFVDVSDDGTNWAPLLVQPGYFRLPGPGSWPLRLAIGWQVRLRAANVDPALPGGAAFSIRAAIE
jgi:hypothetical protein